MNICTHIIVSGSSRTSNRFTTLPRLNRNNLREPVLTSSLRELKCSNAKTLPYTRNNTRNFVSSRDCRGSIIRASSASLDATQDEDEDGLLSRPLRHGIRRVAPVFLVEQVMTRDVVTLHTTTPIREAVEAFLHTNKSGFPVVDADKKLVGIISLADILWHEAMEEILEAERSEGHLSIAMVEKVTSDTAHSSGDGFLQGNVLESMTTSPLTANPEMLISEAAAIMLTHSVTRLPVIAKKGARKGEVIGIVTRSDVMKCMAAAML